MNESLNDIYTADFETTGLTNFEKDGYVRVYLWSLVSLDCKQKYHGTTLESFFDKVLELKATKIWFHNLKFDGTFIVSFLVENGLIHGDDFTTIINGMNIWYEIKIETDYGEIRIWDSLKKFPGLSVAKIAKLYGIPDKMECPDFTRYIPEDYEPYELEIEYCIRDSEIIARALSSEYKKNRRKMTLSSDSFNEVKKYIGGRSWRNTFPDLSDELDNELRLSYKGGWTYLNPIYQNKELDNVTVYDVNSLYPHVMRNCPLPVGIPVVRDKPYSDELYIVSFETMFTLRDGFLPTVQIKNNPGYNPREYLNESTEPITLTMTNIDYEMFKRHYELDYEDNKKFYCFSSKVGLLKDYIDYYMSIKEKATIDGNKAERTLAKLCMNSPYGKTGSKRFVINKVPMYDSEEDKIAYVDVEDRIDGIYVPYASFVCAQARNITISMAQKNYDDFVYADTDSLHLLNYAHDGLEIHHTKLGAWDNEGTFPKAKYIRPKRYIHCDENYNVLPDGLKCAGMPDDLKQSITWDTFVPEAEFEGKITQKKVKGGCILYPTTFKLKI